MLASLQDGIVVWEQLLALGVGRGQIARRVKSGSLHPLHVGVYVWARPEPAFEGRARAAVLASGRSANASHDASLALYGVRPAPEGAIDVTAVGRRPRGRGIRGHCVATLHPDDVATVNGIAVTSPARALLEIAARLPALELADAVERAQINHLVTKQQLAAALARAPGRAGCAALRTIVEDAAITRSRAERKLVALLRAARLPEPIFNGFVEEWEVDALWPDHRVALEFDSYTFHATRAAFERDRRKGAALTRHRHLVLRTTWTELTRQSHALVARIAEALAYSATPMGAEA